MVLVPIAITIWVIVLMLRFTEGVIGKYLPFYFPGMGIITLFLGIYFVGWLSSCGGRLVWGIGSSGKSRL